MATKESHNGPLSRDFYKVHSVVRDMALRGYRNAEEYAHIFISKKKYDKVLSKLRFALNENRNDESDVLRAQMKDGKKQYYVLNQPMKRQDNPLANLWRYAVLDRETLFFYISILGGLDSSEGKTISELVDFVMHKSIGTNWDEEGVDEEKIIRGKVENNLKRMVAQRIVCGKTEKGKKGKVYYLEKPVWDEEFEEEELLEIHDYLDFLKNTMPFELPYYLLQKNLELYMSMNRIQFEKNEDEKLFLFRNRNIINVLDSEKIYIFLRGVKNKEILNIVDTEENTELHRLKRGSRDYELKIERRNERDVIVEKVRYVRRTGEMYFWLADAVFEDEEKRYMSTSPGERVEFDSKKKPEAVRDIFSTFHSCYFDKIIYLCSQKKKEWTEAELEKELFGENADIHLTRELLTKNENYWIFPYDKEKKVYYNQFDEMNFMSTRLHREALKSFEEIPFTKTFLRPDIIEKIKQKMQDFECSWSINDIEKCFDRGGESETGKIELPSYKDMKELLSAIRNKRIVTNMQEKSFAPLKLQYSVRNENFRLLVYDPELETCKVLSLEEIDFTKIEGKIIVNKEFIHVKQLVETGMQNLEKMQKKLSIKLTTSVKAVNNDNLLTSELFMMLSSYEHVVQYSEEEGEFDIEITYWPEDEEELLEDLKVCSVGFYKQIRKDGTLLKL